MHLDASTVSQYGTAGVVVGAVGAGGLLLGQVVPPSVDISPHLALGATVLTALTSFFGVITVIATKYFDSGAIRLKDQLEVVNQKLEAAIEEAATAKKEAMDLKAENAKIQAENIQMFSAMMQSLNTITAHGNANSQVIGAIIDQKNLSIEKPPIIQQPLKAEVKPEGNQP